MNEFKESKILKAAEIVNAVLITISILLAVYCVFRIIFSFVHPDAAIYKINYLGYIGLHEQLPINANHILALELYSKGVIHVLFKNPLLALWASLIITGSTACMLYIFFTLKAFFKALKKDNIFIPKHVDYLKRIGYATVAGVLYYYLSSALLDYIVLSSITKGIPYIPFWNNLPNMIDFLAYLIFGLLLIVFCEIFRISTEMKQEHDLTI